MHPERRMILRIFAPLSDIAHFFTRRTTLDSLRQSEREKGERRGSSVFSSDGAVFSIKRYVPMDGEQMQRWMSTSGEELDEKQHGCLGAEQGDGAGEESLETLCIF